MLGVVSKTIVNATWGGSPKGVWFHGVLLGVLSVALSCDCAEPPGSLTAQSAAIHALRAFKGLVAAGVVSVSRRGLRYKERGKKTPT